MRPLVGRGFPDRTVLIRGRIAFVELKAPGEKPRPEQYKWLKDLRALGFVAGWADNVDDAWAIVEEALN